MTGEYFARLGTAGFNSRQIKQIDCLKKAVFGQKSEKTEVILKNSEQLPLEGVFNEAETEERKEESVVVPEHKRKKKHSRAEIIGNLPTEEVIHNVEDRNCDVCGNEMATVGKEFVRDETSFRRFLRMA